MSLDGLKSGADADEQARYILGLGDNREAVEAFMALPNETQMAVASAMQDIGQREAAEQTGAAILPLWPREQTRPHGVTNQLRQSFRKFVRLVGDKAAIF